MLVNRKEAGALLYKELVHYKNDLDAVVVSLPRGGVPVGYEIAYKLHLPLELALTKKIGHPQNKEFAIGAVTLDSKIVDPWAVEEVPSNYINEEVERLRKLLKERALWYYGSHTPIDLKNKVVIIVDDGVATGNTLISSILLIQQQKPKEIVVALPIAPVSSIMKIKELTGVEKVICLETPLHFQSVGQFYEDFGEVRDEEVMRLMKMAHDSHEANRPKLHS